jgi:tetratricopeptide (TPR) repeat protein
MENLSRYGRYGNTQLHHRPHLMRQCNWRSLPFILFLSLHAAPCISAQAGADTACQAKRREAVRLFDQGKRLEALPLLEELVQAYPKDDALLVALAASLVDHAATLTDVKAAGKERLRARDFLDKAWDLGNTSPLAMNLAQLLRQLPANGAIKFSDNPQVEQFMRAGEAAFSRRDFDEALKDYSKALELEPKNYTAALFFGNAYDKQNQFAKGAEWYERAIQLDPNVETAYRYYADMLAKQGDMTKARAMLIQAAVAEPYNRIVWRELRAWATLNDTQINLIYAGIPAAPKDGGAAGINSNPHKPPVVSVAWDAYQAVRTNWQRGGEFKKRFPDEKEYRHTLAEESEALIAAAKVLEKRKDNNTAESGNQTSSLLPKLYEAGLVEPYVLFSLGDAGIARDYAGYRAGNRKKLEEYMDKFVVPPAH